jgi:hypothetical protein
MYGDRISVSVSIGIGIVISSHSGNSVARNFIDLDKISKPTTDQ